MYGGVATPLALLHQMQQGGVSEMNGRGKQQRPSSSRDEGGANSGGGTSSHSHHGSFSSGMHPSLLMRNTSRLPPLRENNCRENGGNGGIRHGECEPLLPLSSSAMKVLPTQQQRSNYINNSSGGGGGGGCGGSSNSGGGSGSKKLHQLRSVGGGDLDNLANLPPPPLPPHKSGQQFTNFQGHPSSSSKSVSRSQDVTRYTPPWPRGGVGLSEAGNNRGSSGGHTNTNNINIVSSSHHQNSTGNDMNSGAVRPVKPYMKPLPKLPGKESASPSHGRHHRSHTRGHNSSAPPLPPHQQPLLPPLPMRPSEHYYSRAEEASIRTKLRNSYNNPLLHLQRHYSDESLPGATGFYFSSPAQQRIHSSADEISSLNHSPSISSSDESYSRTTDADASPSPSPPHAAAGDRTSTQQWLYPSDIQVDPSSSLENSPRASLDYIPPHCYLPGAGGNHNNDASGVGQSGGGKISNVTPSQDLPPPNLTTSRSFSPSSHLPNSRGNRSNASSMPGVGVGNNASATTRHDWNLSPARHHTGDASAERSSASNSRSRNTKSTVATNTETLPPATLLALAAASNTIDSKCCSPLSHSLDGQDSYRGDSCGSFEYIGHRSVLKHAEKPQGIHRASSANGESCHSAGSGRSPSRSLRQLHHQDKRQGGASGSVKALPCDSAAVVSPDDNNGTKGGGAGKQPSGDDSVGERDHPSACGDDVEEENSRATSTGERSSKKDGSSQTDRKDMLSKSHRRRNSSSSGAGGIGTKAESHIPLLSSINTRSLGTDSMGSALAGKLSSPLAETGSKYHYQGAAAVIAKIPDFEREIQRLLEDQNLLKNIPPKCEKTHQNKEIISLEELKNVNQVLTELGHSSYLLEKDPVVGMLGRYVLSKSDHMVNNNNNNNNNSNCSTPHPPQQVGLAAIQELARRQQDELNNIVAATDRNRTGFCFNPILENKIALSQQQFPPMTCVQQHCDRESSRESSLKRGRNRTPSSPTVEHNGARQEFKALKVQRTTSAVSPMDTISGGGNVVPCANSPSLCATTENRGSCQGVHRFPISRYALSG